MTTSISSEANLEIKVTGALSMVPILWFLYEYQNKFLKIICLICSTDGQTDKMIYRIYVQWLTCPLELSRQTDGQPSKIYTEVDSQKKTFLLTGSINQ